MANAYEHSMGAALCIGGISLTCELWRGDRANLVRPLAATLLATATASLPDLLEPATNPNHRQLFHSWACGAGLMYGMYRLYRWQPEEDWRRALKFGLLVIGGAYVTHLAMDAVTPKSLPLIGKL